ncbi:hypothetical protein GYH30_043530 [Glycine max]|nr:hypothetical protein GYH30_043530 [Glycine max]
MEEHFLEHDGERGVMAVDHHCHGVADETDVDVNRVEVHHDGVVVGGDHGDRLGGMVLLPQLAQCYTLKSSIMRWKMKVKEEKERRGIRIR